MQINNLTSRGIRTGVLAALLTVLAALTLVVQGLAVPAAADVNNRITVDNLALTRITYQGQEQPDKPLRVGSLALLRFTWDARNAELKEGDQFSVALPEEVKFTVPTTKDFLHDFDGDGVAETKVGECAIEAQLLTCTFNNELPERIKGGFKDIHGSGKVQVTAVKSTTTSKITVTINAEKKVEVPLPKDEPIPPGSGTPSPYQPMPFDKSAWGMTENDLGPVWNIYFSTGLPTSGSTDGYLAGLYDVGYFDGTTVRDIVFTDVLGDGQKFPDLDKFNLVMRNSKNSALRHHPLAQGSTSVSTELPGFSIVSVEVGEKTAEGTPATITVRGPFAPDTNYRLQYRALADPATADGKAVPGTVYTNRASVQGTKLEKSAEQYFTESFSIDLTLTVGYGTFSVAKYVGGNGASQVPADAAFAVKVDYTLPLTADKYPGWTAPGTLDADNRSGTATLEAVKGKTTVFTGPVAQSTFPVGTVVTLSEVLDSSSAPPAGYAWSAPSFTVGSTTGETVTLTITDGGTTPVELRNTTEAQSNYFQVLKKADGAPRAADKDYTFTYTCTLPDQTRKTGEITAKGDGVAVRGPELPVGTTCTVAEDAAKAAIDGYTLDASGAGEQTVTIGLTSAETVTATFTNAYSPVPTPTPSATKPGKRPPLAKTGASNVVLLGVVGVALVAGGGLAVLVRRRRDDA
ncbi:MULTISPECIES: DUF5979 domain-containing protein [unclassified Actinomyces]|uniref:DUF7926 domain-containing protein n=1 Tax=unclassified Actinomyces TaxID=2609248 RepID=UPI0020176F7F|nr:MULTISPECIES: DUF5979 domain-containing protein [unclassified Actinomyces]MCL3776824.1 LPXTG cell wall anchor domain-containing protein [Actinomyces sp. AC-20-1]MCL3789733.1 LPXTG cell wall anchor domain-containing protein [Actinomyces sp. 187325]MCL3792090.1 LPXTG cell wall anchor domain-containing protein [Actinomyces sp. 186855]MCL3794731.1 LPXTG cell wall anchor domain-containing protein [Actinomyces sp. 217892]